MKKLLMISLIPALVSAMLFMVACVDPVSTQYTTPEIRNWPARSTMDEYKIPGLQERIELAGAENLRHINYNNSLTLLFNGTSDPVRNQAIEEAVKDYFCDWIPDEDSPVPGVFAYYKGNIYVMFSANSAPNYQIEVFKDSPNIKGDIAGWPSQAQLESYGLHGFNDSLPMDVVDLFYNFTEAETLSIKFWGTGATDDALIGYFEKPANNWTYDPGDPLSPDYVPGYRSYYRGIASVSIYESEKPYYIIEITRTITGFPGWPLLRESNPYGLHGITRPDGASIINYEIEGSIFIIKFYGTPVTESAVLGYFENPANNWTYDPQDPESPDYTTDKNSYYRGIASATFDVSQKPYYEIYVTREEWGAPGWAARSLLEQYGLHGMPWAGQNLPSGAEYVSHGEDTAPDESGAVPVTNLTIKFYGTAATRTAIENYFTMANNWAIDIPVDSAGIPVLPAEGVTNYRRGITYVIFDTSAYPYYELSIYVEKMDGIADWPSVEVLKTFGLHNMPFMLQTLPQGATQTVHIIDSVYALVTDLVTGTTTKKKSLTISFYGEPETERAIESYFTTANRWAPQPADPVNSPNTLFYQRGLAYAAFNKDGYPYYELTVDIEWPELDVEGWPTAAIQNTYGLHGLPWANTSFPAGSDPRFYEALGYSIDTADDNSRKKTLTIRFYGEGNIENTITNYFNLTSNRWARQPDDPLYPGTFLYARGPAFVVFDTSEKPYYELVATFGSDGEAWPGNAILESYGLHLTTAPTGSPTDISYQISGYVTETDPATGLPSTSKTLSMRFNGASAATNLRSQFGINGWKVASDVTPPAGTTVYSRGFAYATLVDENPYYELEISFSPEGSPTDIPAGTLSSFQINTVTLPVLNDTTTHRTWALEKATDSVTGLPTTIDELVIRYYSLNDTIRTSLTTWGGGVETVYPSGATGANIEGYGYDNGIAYVYLNIEAKPYYELYVDQGIPMSDGWPTNLVSTFGLNGAPTTRPANVTTSSWGVSPEGELKMVFTGAITSATVRGWFSTWIDKSAAAAASPNYYSKGNYNAELIYTGTGTITYTLVISPKEAHGSGWPVSTVWASIGLGEYFVNYTPAAPAVTANSMGYTVEDGEINIWFNGVSSTTTTSNASYTAIAGIFNNTWRNKPDDTGTINEFCKGLASVEFNHSKKGSGYYEITISKRGVENWPTSTLLNNNNLAGLDTALAAATRKGYEDNGADGIIVWFFGDVTLKAAVTSYFVGNTNWDSDSPVVSGNNTTYDHNTQTWEALFFAENDNGTGNMYYEIEVIK